MTEQAENCTAPVVSAQYGEKVKFRYNGPEPEDPRRSVPDTLPIRYPDFSIRLTYYDSQDHANVEIEEFRFEITAGAETVDFSYQFDHWSDTEHHDRHPEKFSIGGQAYTLWHYASRESLEYNEFIIEKTSLPKPADQAKPPEKKNAEKPGVNEKSPKLSKAEKEERRKVRGRELLKAAKEGDLDGVKRALLGGARVETVTHQNGRTALLEAAARGHFEIVKLLVERGADLKATDHKARSAIALAANSRIREYDIDNEIGNSHHDETLALLTPTCAGLAPVLEHLHAELAADDENARQYAAACLADFTCAKNNPDMVRDLLHQQDELVRIKTWESLLLCDHLDRFIPLLKEFRRAGGDDQRKAKLLLDLHQSLLTEKKITPGRLRRRLKLKWHDLFGPIRHRRLLVWP